MYPKSNYWTRRRKRRSKRWCRIVALDGHRTGALKEQEQIHIVQQWRNSIFILPLLWLREQYRKQFHETLLLFWDFDVKTLLLISAYMITLTISCSPYLSVLNLSVIIYYLKLNNLVNKYHVISFLGFVASLFQINKSLTLIGRPITHPCETTRKYNLEWSTIRYQSINKTS